MTTTQDQTLKRTSLYDRHVALGGKIVPFAGYELPIYYSSIMEEHVKVREEVGLFDVSHLGEIQVIGKDSYSFLNQMVPNDLGSLKDSQITYSILLNEGAGILDDILIYKLDNEHFYLVVNASNISKIYNHLTQHKSGDVEVVNKSDECSCIAIQGPKSLELCETLLNEKLSDLPYYFFKNLTGKEDVWISRTGYTGEDGFEIFANPQTILEYWDLLVDKGTSFGLKPVGLGARNTLRLEVGNGLYGADFNESTLPFEVRLGWLVSKDKEFFGSKAYFSKKESDINNKRLCGFQVNERAVARDGYKVYKDEAAPIGHVTSGSFSPTLKKNIGMAFIDRESSKVGSQIFIEVHNKKVAAEVVKLPFVPIRHK